MKSKRQHLPKTLSFFYPPKNANVFFLFTFSNSLLFKYFVSIIFCFTLTNIFSGSQEIYFRCICFDKWIGNCALQSDSRISDEKTARSTMLLSRFSVLSLCTSLTRSSFFFFLVWALGHLLFFSDWQLDNKFYH